MEGKWDSFFLLSGIKCSSWVGINVGTSGRSFANPMGFRDVKSVAEANSMVSRTCGLDFYRVLWAGFSIGLPTMHCQTHNHGTPGEASLGAFPLCSNRPG
jgi:hypothetical protein